MQWHKRRLQIERDWDKNYIRRKKEDTYEGCSSSGHTGMKMGKRREAEWQYGKRKLSDQEMEWPEMGSGIVAKHFPTIRGLEMLD